MIRKLGLLLTGMGVVTTGIKEVSDLVQHSQHHRSCLHRTAIKQARKAGRDLLIVGPEMPGMLLEQVGVHKGTSRILVDGSVLDWTTSADPIDVLRTLASKSHTVFLDHCVEFSSDPQELVKLAKKVAGSQANLVVAHLPPQTLTAWMLPGIKNRVLSAPPVGKEVVFETLPWRTLNPGRQLP